MGGKVDSLKNIRKEMNLTQLEMANKLEISVSYYSKIENGSKMPSYNFIKRFSDEFPSLDANIFFSKSNHQL